MEIINNGPATTFTFNLFLKKPYLFDIQSLSLLYTKFAGVPYPVDSLYEIFTHFVTYNNPDRIKLQRLGALDNINGFLNPLVFKHDPHLIITWARVFQQLKTSIVFEPVMELLKNVMNDWINNKKLLLSSYRPLCYNSTGENYFNLLPYLCYLITFFIHCRPFSFNEEYSHASSYSFTTAFENWLKIQYTKLANDNGKTLVNNYDVIDSIPDDELSEFLKFTLHPKKIIEIRNEAMMKEETLLDECVSDQMAVNESFVKDAWERTMTHMLEIVVNNSPIKILFSKLPTYNPRNVNTKELMLLTQYCLGGGNTPFCIEYTSEKYINGFNSEKNTSGFTSEKNISEMNINGENTNTFTGGINTSKNINEFINEESINDSYSYIIHGDPSSIKEYPKGIFGIQSLASKIKTLNICKSRPFSCSDFILDCCIAYVKEKYDNKRLDFDDPYPIVVTEEDLQPKMKQTLINLFVNGLWMFDNSSMSSALTILLKEGFNINFTEQLMDLLQLESTTKLFYGNSFASTLIVPYLLSFINSNLLDSCNNRYQLRNFDIFSYLSTEVDESRINKLTNMLVALMHINNETYFTFVNYVSDEFVKIIETSNPKIVVPYVKGVNDHADEYAIGGIEMYNYASYSNPFVRSYGFYSYVFGNFENLECFYKNVSLITNDAALDVMNDVKNTSSVASVIRNQLEKVGKVNTLKNFNFYDNGNYVEDNSIYAVNLSNSENVNIIELLSDFTFNRTNISDIREQTIITREVEYLGGGKLNVKQPTETMKLSPSGITMMLPLYDIRGEVVPMSVVYQLPPNHKLIPLMLFNSRVDNNSVAWIFTSVRLTNRFNGYLKLESNTPASATLMSRVTND